MTLAESHEKNSKENTWNHKGPVVFSPLFDWPPRPVDALRQKAQPARQVRPVTIEGDPVPPMTGFWPVTNLNGTSVGRISSAVHAFTYNENIAIGLIDRSHWNVDTELLVQTSNGMRSAKIRSGFPSRQAKS